VAGAIGRGLGPVGVCLTDEHAVEVGEEEVGQGPALETRVPPYRGRVGREIVNQDGEPSDGKLAPPVPREVDAVEALEICLYGVGIVAE
jgi:hypothetical protein